MNLRRTLLLALILLVLAGVATVMEKNRKQARAPRTEALFPTFELESVDGLRIDHGENTIELSKVTGTWLVVSEDNKPADPALVEKILEKIVGLNGAGRVSVNASSHGLYEVDEAGVVVRISQEDTPTAWFVVGKPGSDFMSSYIRLHDQDETYRVPVYLRPDVDRGSRTWRNLNVLSLDLAEVASYTYTPEGEPQVTVAQDEAGTWTITEPEARPTQAQIMGIVTNSLANIRATGFADTIDVATAGFDSTGRELQIRERNGTSHVIEIGSENEQRQSYTRLRGSDAIFLVPVGRWNTIFRSLNEIAPAPAGAG